MNAVREPAAELRTIREIEREELNVVACCSNPAQKIAAQRKKIAITPTRLRSSLLSFGEEQDVPKKANSSAIMPRRTCASVVTSTGRTPGTATAARDDTSRSGRVPSAPASCCARTERSRRPRIPCVELELHDAESDEEPAQKKPPRQFHASPIVPAISGATKAPS